jgi:hypothetical protein
MEAAMFVSRNIRPENFPTDVMPSPLCREPRQQARIVQTSSRSATIQHVAKAVLAVLVIVVLLVGGVVFRFAAWGGPLVPLVGAVTMQFAAWGDPLIH